MSEPEAVYAELSRLLSTRRDRIYDIEIVPAGFAPLVHDGVSIGITKAALAQAFCIARKRFFGSLENTQTKLLQNTHSEQDELSDERTSTDTEIILLFDGEHLTACNWRKRRILRIVEGPSHGAVNLFLAEITFTTTLLRSPLHRHAKSPTLWHHRFWTISQLLLQNGSRSLDSLLYVLCDEQSQEPKRLHLENAQRVVRAELGVALKASEQHPMNYYAFSYMRQFLRLIESVLVRLHQEGYAGATPEDHTSSSLHTLARDLVLDMHAWNLSRPGDTSGWSFLAFLLDMAGDPTLQQSVVEKTARFALGIGWGGEPLWRFVDECLERFDVNLHSDLLPPDLAKGTYGAPNARRWESWARWTKECSRET